MTKQPTMADLREQCRKLGITPARSIAETMARIEQTRIGIEAATKPRNQALDMIASPRALDAYLACLAQAPRMSHLMRHMADSTSLATGILRAHPIIYQGDVQHQRAGAAFVVEQMRTGARLITQEAMRRARG